MYKNLPNGNWISFGNIDPAATDEEFQTYLYDAGIEMPIENISVSVHRSNMRAAAVVSFSREQVMNLVERAVQGLAIRGRTPNIFIPEIPNEPRRRGR
jgi:hypothetical protein